MTDVQLQSFLQVAKLGSFSKAEQSLHISKQAVIKQMGALEAELGFRLFDRSAKGAKLTPAGKAFAGEVEKSMQKFELVVAKCREIALNEHVIRIGSPSHPRLVLEKAINEFSKRYPQVKQEIVFYGNKNATVSLLDGAIDIVEAPYNPQWMLPGISYSRVSDLPWMCLLSDTHPLANHQMITMGELKGHKVGIARKKNNAWLLAQLEDCCPGIQIDESQGEEVAFMLNYCLARGVYLTKAIFATSLPPLKAIPLEAGVVPQTGVYYLSNPTDAVKKYIEVIEEIYSADPVQLP